MRTREFPVADDTRWSVPWAERPAEEARVFNPAFCSELIGHTVHEYHRVRQETLGMVITFLVLPLTLHRPTREALPLRASKVFAGWVAENSALVAELPERTRRLRPVSREALLFALRHQRLALEGGGLLPGTGRIRRGTLLAASTDEVKADTSSRRTARSLVCRAEDADGDLAGHGSYGMTFQLRSISIYSHSGERRDVTFRLGALNIVTGGPKTGKSALLDIVDYCWGRDECTVPQGEIRRGVSWFAVFFDNEGEGILVARKNPGPVG